MSCSGHKWLAHSVPATTITRALTRLPAHQDNFLAFLQRANDILHDVQEEGNETLPAVRVVRFLNGVWLCKAYCRHCFAVLWCPCLHPTAAHCCSSAYAVGGFWLPWHATPCLVRFSRDRTPNNPRLWWRCAAIWCYATARRPLPRLC